jgi:threonine dehydrogenase-like Zn-dependent dehydrogenase
MPKQLIAVKPHQAELLEDSLSPLLSNEVRIKVDFASPKHGTEATDFKGGSPWETEQFDTEYRLFTKRPQGNSGIAFGSWNLGNMFVGHIIELGKDVKDYQLGDRVCSYGGIKEFHTMNGINNFRLRKLSESDSWKNAVCYDPAQYALGGVRDAEVKPGDHVAIVGLGAIGLIAMQIVKRMGCYVVGIDPIEKRRNIALGLGADLVLDPTKTDVGFEMKKETQKVGMDVVIETSGSPYALQSAIRGLGYGGTICYLAFAKEFKGGLNFGQEAHFNNIKIVFTRAANDPNREHPRWDRRRIEETVWKMLMKNEIQCETIIEPVIPFHESAEGFMKYVDQSPELSVKLGIYFEVK